MSDIPLARQIIDGLIDELEAAGEARLAAKLEGLVPLLYRRQRVRQARARSEPMTPDLARVIRAFAARHPDLPIDDIAARFAVNAGRVSEALHHDR